MRRLLSLLALTLPIWFVQPAMAESTTAVAPVDPSEPTVIRNSYKDWQSICVSQQQATNCQITQTMQVEKDGEVSFAMRITLFKQAENIVMEVTLPLGLNLQSGIAIQVDESNEINIPFVTCVAQGCAATIAADAGLLKLMREGTTLKVAFRPFAQADGILLNASLRGFTGAVQVLSH
jgi:invasion protein IalB